MSYLAKPAIWPKVAIFTLSGASQWNTTTQITWTPTLTQSTTIQPHVGIVGSQIELSHGSYMCEYHIAGTKQSQSVTGTFTINFQEDPSIVPDFIGSLGGDPIENRHDGCKATFEVKGNREFISFSTSSFTNANFNLIYTDRMCFVILWKVR